MVAMLLVLALNGPAVTEGSLPSAPDNPICKEVWEILWEYQQYTELTDAQVRQIAGSCVDWAEGLEAEVDK